MVRLHVLAALGGTFVVGCSLFYQKGELPPSQIFPANEKNQVAEAKSSDPTGPKTPYNPSPIQPDASRIMNAAPPLLVKFESGPGPAPSEPAKKDEPGPIQKDTDPDPPPPGPVAPTPAPMPRLVMAMLCALEKNPDEARELLNAHESGDRELMLSLIRLLAVLERKQIGSMSVEDVTRTLDHLRTLTTQLRPCVPLKLEKLCFCRKIEGFGQYELLPTGHKFTAGSDGQPGERMQVYVEVRNFNCKQNQDKFETRLSSSLEIRDEKNQPVATMTPETSTDVSQTPRQDYFLNFQFHVPPSLKAGNYTLWVTVKDITCSTGATRCESKSHDFVVGPPGGLK